MPADRKITDNKLSCQECTSINVRLTGKCFGYKVCVSFVVTNLIQNYFIPGNNYQVMLKIRPVTHAGIRVVPVVQLPNLCTNGMFLKEFCGLNLFYGEIVSRNYISGNKLHCTQCATCFDVFITPSSSTSQKYNNCIFLCTKPLQFDKDSYLNLTFIHISFAIFTDRN